MEKENNNIQTECFLEVAVPNNPTEVNKSKSFTEKLKDSTYSYKFYISIALLVAFGAMGFQTGQKGPSFLDLQLITDTDTKTASSIFTVMSVGYLSGSVALGFLNERVNQKLSLFGSTLLLGLSVIVIPLCSIFGVMLLAIWTNAFFAGWLNTAGNAYLLLIWGSVEGRSYMQALHSVFAAGAIISPFVTAPFLKKVPHLPAYNISIGGNISRHNLGSTNTTFVLNSSDVNLENNQTSTIINDEDIQLFYAYLIAGCITIIAAACFLALYCKFSPENLLNTDKVDATPIKRELPLKYHILTVFVVDLFFLVYCAIEDSFANYIPMFSVVVFNWDKQHASQITSAFWGSFAASRFLGILLVRYIRPVRILVVYTSLMVATFTTFLLFAHYKIFTGVWLIAVSAGFSMSVIFPTGFLWVQEKFVKITGRVASSILIAASIGSMVNPLIIGYLMQIISPIWLCYIFMIESLLLLSILLILMYISVKVLPKIRKQYIN